MIHRNVEINNQNIEIIYVGKTQSPTKVLKSLTQNS